MAQLTKEDIDKILGRQSIADRVLPVRGDVLKAPKRGIITGTWADILKPITSNPVAEFLGAADVQRALNSASYNAPITTGGSIQTGGIRPEYLMAALALTPTGKGKKAADVAKKTVESPKAIGNLFDNVADYETAKTIAEAGGHLKRDASGKYIGAPSWVDTPQKLTKMRKEVDRKVAAGTMGADWYDKARQAYMDVTGYNPETMGYGTATNEGKAASLFSRGGAAYSPQAAPPLETANFLTQFNNKVLFGKDVTPRTGAQAKNVSQAFTFDPNTGGYLLEPERIKLGKKTEPYAQSKDPTVDMNNMFNAANDIWQGRVFGYTDPSGKLFSRGFTPQEHGFLTGENILASERATKAGVPVGNTNLPMNTMRMQAGSWITQRFEQAKADQAAALSKYNKDIAKWEKASPSKRGAKPTAPVMQSDEEIMQYAMAGIPETIPRHVANETYEYVTGENVGHLAGLNKLPENVRNEYTRKMAAAYGERDPYYEALQMYQLPQVNTIGEYLNSAGVLERNAGISARPLVDLESSLLTSKTGSQVRGGAQLGGAGREALNTATEIRTMLNANEAGAYNKFTKANSSMKPVERNSARIQGSQEELSKVKAALEKQNVDAINVGDAIHVADFSGSLSAKQIQDAIKTALKNADAKVTTQVGRLETGYIPVDWGKEGSGQVTNRLVEILKNSPIQNLGQRLDTSRLPSALLSQNEIDRATAAAFKLKEREDLYKLRNLLADPRVGFKGLPQYVEKYGSSGLPAVFGLSLLSPDEQR